MKKIAFLITTLLFVYGSPFCQNNKKIIDLQPRLSKMNLQNGINVVEKNNEGYQLVIEKNGKTKTWKIIDPGGQETVVTPVPIKPSVAKRKSANRINKGLNGPVVCEICYTYPDGMQICYRIPCP